MKKSILFTVAALKLLIATPLLLAAADANTASAPKIASVDFKKVVEESKYGKREQANFEGLKKQMETVLEEKEKALTDMESKFNDPDYLDSLSPEAENEMKNNFRTINQELGQIQSQYYQTLNQANMLILQQLGELVSKSAAQAAKDSGFDMILSTESGFYFAPNLDLSQKIISLLNEQFDKEQKEKPTSK